MNPDLSEKVVEKIENLCENGCSQVNELLEKVKKGESIDALQDFDTAETKQIIDELTQIMSVYESDK